ncbi:hypothetical protein PV328_012228, partial [Microctonus aethiopoides]
ITTMQVKTAFIDTSVSPVLNVKTKDFNNYKIEIKKPISANEQISLTMSFRTGEQIWIYEPRFTWLCDKNYYTIEGTLASIVRHSMGLECPADQGTKIVPATFKFEGEILKCKSPIKCHLDVHAYQNLQEIFVAVYIITPDKY